MTARSTIEVLEDHLARRWRFERSTFHWVLPTLEYESKEDLLDGENLKTYIIDRAVAKREELRKAKNQEPEAILIRKIPAKNC